MLVQGAIPQILETVPQSFYDDTLNRLKVFKVSLFRRISGGKFNFDSSQEMKW